MSEFNIQYQGFHPSEFTRNYLDFKLSEIMDRAPYGSNLRATFIREGHNVKAQIRINSAAGEFFGRAQGRRLRDVGRKAFYQVQKQIDRWKHDRHGGRGHGSDVA